MERQEGEGREYRGQFWSLKGIDSSSNEDTCSEDDVEAGDGEVDEAPGKEEVRPLR